MLACGQIIGGLGALMLLALFPPAEGPMRLISLVPDAPRLAVALRGGARIVDASADGRLVVYGRRGALVPVLLRAGVLPLAIDPDACGKGRR